MALDQAQRTTLAAHIRANPDSNVMAALAQRNDTELARLYNLPSSFVVWREAITPAEYREAINWTEVDALSIGAARIWEWITQNMTTDIDAAKTNVRTGLADVFGAATATRAALLALAKVNAAIGEEVFATGTGTTQNPGTRVHVGDLTIQDIGRALNENP